MFHRITVGLKGRILRVASIAERLLLKLGGSAPGGCGRACPALGGLSVVGSCWRDCLVVGPPVVALGVGVGVSVCLRFRRGRALRVGGGLPPRRCACTVPCAPVCASALAVAAAASSTVWRIRGSSHSAAAAAALAAVRRAAAAGLSATGLCRSSVRLDSGSAAAEPEALAALAGLSLALGWVRAVRFTTGLKDRSIFIRA